MEFCPPARSNAQQSSRGTEVSVTIVADCAIIKTGTPTTGIHCMLSMANILRYWLTGQLRISKQGAELVIRLSLNGKRLREPKSSAFVRKCLASAAAKSDPDMPALARIPNPFA